MLPPSKPACRSWPLASPAPASCTATAPPWQTSASTPPSCPPSRQNRCISPNDSLILQVRYRVSEPSQYGPIWPVCWCGQNVSPEVLQCHHIALTQIRFRMHQGAKMKSYLHWAAVFIGHRRPLFRLMGNTSKCLAAGCLLWQLHATVFESLSNLIGP